MENIFVFIAAQPTRSLIFTAFPPPQSCLGFVAWNTLGVQVFFWGQNRSS